LIDFGANPEDVQNSPDAKVKLAVISPAVISLFVSLGEDRPSASGVVRSVEGSKMNRSSDWVA
jgi:hypothetical protein